MPFARPGTDQDVAVEPVLGTITLKYVLVAVGVQFAALEVHTSTRYPRTGNPPVSEGAVHDRSARPSAPTAARPPTTPAGALGMADTTVGALTPPAVTALTRNEYAEPFTRPVTTNDVSVEPVLAVMVVQVAAPESCSSMRYPVGVTPAAGVHESVTWESPGVARKAGEPPTWTGAMTEV